jgi:DNA adenine methylase
VKQMTDDDYKEFNEYLKCLQGRFILSLNDCGFVRKTFRGFHTENVVTRYSMANRQNKRVTELMIKNF